MAITFDGVDDYVAIGTPATLNNLSSITASAWIYANSTGATKTILGKDNVHGWEFSVRTGNTVGMIVSWNSTANYVVRVPTTTFTLSAWHNILVTYDGTNLASGINIYIDGTLATGGTSTNGSGSRDDDSTSPLDIGADDNGTALFFDGSITEVAVWNTVISTDAIKQLAVRTKGTPKGFSASNLSMYLPMDDSPSGSANGATCNDLSGNGNNGTGNYGANATGCTWLIDPLYGKLQTKGWWGDR